MYAGALGDNAVERYALFLTSLALSADPVERRAALQRARDHGLDVSRVAIVTAERTIERALESLPSSVKGQLPNLGKAAQEPAEEAEMLLVRSIEWTVVEGETYDTALEQANVILRYLLGAWILPYLPSHVVYTQSCCEQLAGGWTWHACSWICFPLNSRRSAYLRSARQSIWITASSSSRGRRSSEW